MENLHPEMESIMQQRFARDSVMALATVENGQPRVRNVDAYYEDGAFYVITWALSGKMQQIAKNPAVALAGEWFTAQGIGENLGWVGAPGNQAMTHKLRKAFAAWIDNGHSNLADENTVLLRLRLTQATLYHHGQRFDFSAE